MAYVGDDQPGQGLTIIVIHRDGCSNVAAFGKQEEKWIPAVWQKDQPPQHLFSAGLLVDVTNRMVRGILSVPEIANTPTPPTIVLEPVVNLDVEAPQHPGVDCRDGQDSLKSRFCAARTTRFRVSEKLVFMLG